MTAVASIVADGRRSRARTGQPAQFIESVVAGEATPNDRGCIIWPFGCTGSGYPALHTRHGQRVVGEVVMEGLGVPRPSSRHTIGHDLHEVCGDRRCIAPAHISWQTWEEQKRNQRFDGTMAQNPTGADHWNATVPDHVVAEAICRVNAGESQTAVARDIGVSRRSVGNWVNGVHRT